MRPIKLKMTAFGAYVKPVELDFEAGLNGANFFLIHGATGAGKTTILDAICFALYGKTSGGTRTGEMMRSEQATPNDKTEVEFTFSLRGKTYRIERSPKYMRASKRGEGLTEEKASAVIFEDGEPVETKNVSEYVENLLQFSPEQFRQVIMLPQGAFQKFLLANSKDKQEVLNMLFNADFFKRVEEELKSRAAAAKNKSDVLTERKKNLLTDGAETLEETDLPALTKKISDELDAAQTQLRTLEARTLTAQKEFGEGEILSRQFGDFAEKSRALTAAETSLKKTSAELAAAQVEFDKCTAEEIRRKELDRLTVELDKKKVALKNLQARQVELAKAEEAKKKSEAEAEKLKRLKRRCDETMVDVKAQEEKLVDAPAKLKSAEQVLKEAQTRAKLLRELDGLRGEILAAEKILAETNIAHEAAEKKLSELRQAQSDGSAARLAAVLEEGKPCPVCGAIHHPKPATSQFEIPTDAQIKSVEREEKSLLAKKNSAEKNLAELKGKLDAQEKSLAENAQVVTVADAQAEVEKFSADVKELQKCRTRIKNGEIKIHETDEALSAANEAAKKFSETANTLRGEVNNILREVDKKYSEDSTLLDAEISSATRELNQLNTAFNRAQENFNRLNAKIAAQRATVIAAEKARDEVAAQVEGKVQPDIVALKKNLDDARTAERAAIDAKAKLSARLERLSDISKKISALNAELIDAEKNSLMWKTLSDTASGKTSRISFQRYYLSTMFKEVILEANNRLEKMSGGRYRFQSRKDVLDGRIRSAGLDLEIVDEYSGTARPVETLSGGESFLASLSLALGLAAVVQNNSGGIKLDTIFIDEGFGTLDSETLDFALKTLIELQSGGRLVGIISHVEELKNQMPVRLEVTKGKTGSTAKFIS